MTQRPIYAHIWAENALPADIGDADVYVPENPVYPEQATDQYKAGWYVSPGNDHVKQPHQWLNSWARTSDTAILEYMQRGTAYDSTVTYQVGSYVQEDGVWWKARVAGQLAAPNMTEWIRIGRTDIKEINLFIAERHATLTTHMARRDAPHEVSPIQIDAYSKTQLDQLVAAVQTDLNSYQMRRDNPHTVTAAQLGVLPTTGGTFTGQVQFALLRLLNNVTVGLQSGTFGVACNAASIGIMPTTSVPTASGSELLHERNYRTIRNRHNTKFVAPAPELELPLVRDFNSIQSGFDDIEFTGTPTFSSDGLLLVEGQTLTVRPRLGNGTQLVTIDGKVSARRGAIPENLLSAISGTRVKDLRLWSTELTDEQCLSLGMTEWLQ